MTEPATVTVSVTDLPAFQHAVQFVVDFIDEYAWHKPSCPAFVPATTGYCECGYVEGLATLGTLAVRPVREAS